MREFRPENEIWIKQHNDNQREWEVELERESDLKYYFKDIADLFFRRKNVIIFNNNKQSRVYTIWIVRA